MTTTLEIDGIYFNVVYEGDVSKPLVVLVHVLMSNLHMWNSTVKALHNAGFSTLRYDHIGHGKTSAPPPTPDRAKRASYLYHFDDFCHHIHKIVSRIVKPGPKPRPKHPFIFSIIGCSMGGVLALRYAMLYPDHVHKIISCDAPGLTSLEDSTQKWPERIRVFRTEGINRLSEMTVNRWFPDPCPPYVRNEALKHTRACTLAGYECCAYAIMHYDYYADLHKVQTQDVLVLAGENDEAIGPPEILMDVAVKIRGAKYVSMKNTGHIPPMHRPADFERIVVGFLLASNVVAT